MNIQNLRLFGVASILLLVSAFWVLTASAADEFRIIESNDVDWFDTGPDFPGTQLAIIYGDPSKAEPATLRFTCPAFYKYWPHTHPVAERFTVLSGTISIGIGETFDNDNLTVMSAGDHVVIPPNTPHYGRCIDRVVIEINIFGPFGITMMER